MNGSRRSIGLLAAAMLLASTALHADDDLARRTALQYARSAGGQPAALAHLVQLTRGSDAAAAEAFDELAAAHVRAGDLNLAAGARRMLLERFPHDKRSAAAALWLARLYASSEIAHAQARSRRSRGGDRALSIQLAAALEGQGAQRELPTPQDVPSGLPAYGLRLVEAAARANPALNDDPALRFQRAAAARLAGDEKAANKFLAPLLRLPANDVWSEGARTEAWLSQSSGRAGGATAEASTSSAAPVPAAACPAVSTRPHLDGVLDDPIWQENEPGEILAGGLSEAANAAAGPSQAAASERPPTVVRFAHDHDFVYLAVRCAKLPNVEYKANPRPRAHDDATGGDRVRVLLDLDRDYATWYELTIDSTGRTADRCGDDAAWNPQWYVAAGQENAGPAGQWTIEAAIPRAELTDRPLAAGVAWACSVERIAPRGERQCWRGPCGDEPSPQRFGLLLLE
jgi:hypothetical protein